jgi:magnesium chelatase subunit H
MRFIILTTQDNYTTALQEASAMLRREHGIDVSIGIYIGTELGDPQVHERLAEDVARADFILSAMVFGEAYVRPVERILKNATCPMAAIMSNPALIRQTRLGKFNMGRKSEDEQEQPEKQGGLSGIMRSMRPKHGHGEASRQLKLIGRLTSVLKYLPGRFRDLHSYVVFHQFWVHNTPDNLKRMLMLIIERYVPGYKGKLPIEDPQIFPDVAIWHPDAPEPFENLKAYHKWLRKHKRPRGSPPLDKGVVGLISLRVIVLGANIEHLATLVRTIESRGLEVRLVYTAGLDGRPAIEKFFVDKHGQTEVDLIATTSGFAMVGGMAQSRPEEARVAFEAVNVRFLQNIPLVFQSVEQWHRDDRGLNPMHIAMNVALAELEGATEPLVYGGPQSDTRVAVPVQPQIDRFAERALRHVTLHRKANAEKKIAVVLFNYPPNLGSVGTAAYLDVFASTYRLLQELKGAGYSVELPADADELRRLITEGNSLAHGTDANIADFLPVEEYRRLFPDYVDIEPFWGNAPGELLSDGRRLQIMGRRFGNVFIGVQPTFGYERDPMRMLMSRDAAPHHGFAAFYTWIDRVFGADAVVHMGTHGALEFMPGKQAGLGPECWPLRLLGGLPNVYYYCVNNPSEGTIARRRGMATLVSYLVPPVQHAGLYKGLRQLKDSMEQYRNQPDPGLLDDIRAQAEKLGITLDEAEAEAYLAKLSHQLLEIEQRLIPVGLHILGRPPQEAELVDILALVASFQRPAGMPATLPALIATELGLDYAAIKAGMQRDQQAQEHWRRVDALVREAMQRLVNSQDPAAYLAETTGIAAERLAPLWSYLRELLGRLRAEHETTGLLNALRGGYVPPSPGNDVVREPAVVPTGRNLHGLDPYRMPSEVAQANAGASTNELLRHLVREQGALPETVALVLWGTDNIKTGGEGVAQALALLGARAVSDELGKIADVELISLAELGRPRIDVVVTASGIFRDLMAHQALLIDKAARLAAAADEPVEQNFIRKHALAQAEELGLSLADAATRVFSNAPGSYGAQVNNMIESGTWDDDEQIGNIFMNRKGFAMNPNGEWQEARPVLEKVLGTVEATFQNVDSVEVGISDVDHYYEYLGGMTKSVEKLRGSRPKVMVAEVEAFSGPGSGRVRSLEQMVRLESRAKLLNPRWFEGMLAHGYEGAHEIEVRISNTYGWSATANAVDGWVYQGVAETYLLDEAMRDRLAELNPQAAAGMARRLLEANDRGFWDADEDTLEQLRLIYADLEDRLEGVTG